MIPLAPFFRSPLMYPDLTSQLRPQYRRIPYKLEVGNEINVSVDATDSRYTGRGLFLLPDGIRETI